MQIEPVQAVTTILAIVAFAGSWFATRERVATLTERLKTVEAEAKEARDSALKAHGADESINNRIGALERSMTELKESQGRHVERVEELVKDAVSQMREIVGPLAREVRELFQSVHKLDKEKLSTGEFRAVRLPPPPDRRDD